MGDLSSLEGHQKQIESRLSAAPDSGWLQGQYLVVRTLPLASVVVVKVAFYPGPMIVRERPLPVAL